MRPPKPASRSEKTSLLNYLRLFRRDILSAQPEKLYRAWMAEFRAPFLRSFLMNDPFLIDLVLRDRPQDFPKSNKVREGLLPLVGNSVFVTNGADWERQRRIIDPAFAGGRLRDTFPAIVSAGHSAVARLRDVSSDTATEIEAQTSYLAADVICRTLFSIPIEDTDAKRVFEAFKTYQRSQPLLNLAAFVPMPRWMPRPHLGQTRKAASEIRALIRTLTEKRALEIAHGTAPDDLATKIMTMRDPQSGHSFGTEEMVDQVAIFFLAGHETSASALAWALYLLATHPDAQERVADEAVAFRESGYAFSAVSNLTFTRSVFRETLRLYPPVPMMVRENTCPERFRGRDVKPGAQVVISPWHLHRHSRLWSEPDAFKPDRWELEEAKASARKAYIPFSAGPRVCTGAGLAMLEGVVLLAMLCERLKFTQKPGTVPIPVAHLTVRARDGINIMISMR